MILVVYLTSRKSSDIIASKGTVDVLLCNIRKRLEVKSDLVKMRLLFRIISKIIQVKGLRDLDYGCSFSLFNSLEAQRSGNQGKSVLSLLPPVP